MDSKPTQSGGGEARFLALVLGATSIVTGCASPPPDVQASTGSTGPSDTTTTTPSSSDGATTMASASADGTSSLEQRIQLYGLVNCGNREHRE